MAHTRFTPSPTLLAAVALAVALPLAACVDASADGGGPVLAAGTQVAHAVAAPALAPALATAPAASRSTRSAPLGSPLAPALNALQTIDPGPEFVVEFPPAEAGEPVGRIVIPKANIDHPIIYGVTPAQLDVSPGLMPRTAMPGQWGNSVVAGHRSTFGSPFHDLHLLEPGDEILIETAIGAHTYAVVSTKIVQPTAMWITRHRNGGWLTIFSCHPIGSNAQRIVVFAKLVAGPNHEAVATTYTGPYLPPRDLRMERILRELRAPLPVIPRA